MTRSNPLLAAFSAGELSPRLHSRVDFSKYPAGLEACVNVIPLPEGGLLRRPGSRYVANMKSASVKGDLKAFQFSTTQAYIIEKGESIFRFYRHQAQIVVADTDAAISNGTFPSGITDWDDVSTGGGSIAHNATDLDLDLDPGGTGGTDIAIAEQDVTTTNTNQEHVLKFQVKGAPGDKIELQIGTASGGSQILAAVEKEVGYHCVAFTPTASPFYVQFRNLGSNANKILSIDDVSLIDNDGVEIDTPYAEADLFKVDGPQSADVLYLFHESYPAYKLQRLGHTTWSLVEVAWQDGPWLTQNTTSTTLTPAATTGLGVNVTASSTTGINGGLGFQSTDVGRLIRIDNDPSGVNWGWAIIVGFTNTTTVTVDIKRAFGSTSADADWRLGAWSGTTGYPSAATFYQQRLVPAGTTDQPQTFWGSVTSDFEVFSPDSPNASDEWDGTVEDDDAFAYTLSSNEVNAIRWLRGGKSALLIGTTGGEWTVTSTGSVVTPTDVNADEATGHGCADVEPLKVGAVALFLQKAKRKIREMVFDFQVDGYQAFDMTRLAQHITKGGITKLAYAEEPDSLVWAVRNDGVLLAMTYRREEDVVAWARQILGGTFSEGDPVVESVAVIPGADGSGQVKSSENRDEVWITVKRTVNGSTARYIEVLEGYWEDGDDQEDAYYADSLITYDGASTTSLTGLTHLNGETVKILADGAIVDDDRVIGAALTLDNAASVVQIGFGYTHTIKPLKLVSGTAAGTPVGKTKQIFGLTFVVLNSHTLTFGPDTDNLRTIDFRTAEDTMGSAVPFYTGEYFTEWDSDWMPDPRMIIQEDDPVPFGLLSLAPETDTRESRG